MHFLILIGKESFHLEPCKKVFTAASFQCLAPSLCATRHLEQKLPLSEDTTLPQTCCSDNEPSRKRPRGSNSSQKFIRRISYLISKQTCHFSQGRKEGRDQHTFSCTARQHFRPISRKARHIIGSEQTSQREMRRPRPLYKHTRNEKKRRQGKYF